jgi:hypothetical protein
MFLERMIIETQNLIGFWVSFSDKGKIPGIGRKIPGINLKTRFRYVCLVTKMTLATSLITP